MSSSSPDAEQTRTERERERVSEWDAETVPGSQPCEQLLLDDTDRTLRPPELSRPPARQPHAALFASRTHLLTSATTRTCLSSAPKPVSYTSRVPQLKLNILASNILPLVTISYNHHRWRTFQLRRGTPFEFRVARELVTVGSRESKERTRRRWRVPPWEVTSPGNRNLERKFVPRSQMKLYSLSKRGRVKKDNKNIWEKRHYKYQRQSPIAT